MKKLALGRIFTQLMITLGLFACLFQIVPQTKAYGAAAVRSHPASVVFAADPTKFVKSDCKGPDIKAGVDPTDPNHCGILDLLQTAINVLSALVGITVVIMIIVGGIQYSSAEDNPQKIAAARSKIVNALIALFVFIFMFALLQYLIPGGIFQ